MNYTDFQNAITSAQAVTPPTTDPVLGKLFGSTFQLAQSNRGAQGLGAAAGLQAQNDQAQAAAEQQKKVYDIKDQIQAIQDKNDPNKYQRVQKQDGGFDYYDPTGNKIPVAQYAQATGKTVLDSVKGSDNNLDLQFQQDYKTMQDIANAYANGDKSYLDKLSKDSGDPNFFKGKTAADIMNIFKQGYPHVYGQGATQGADSLRPVQQAPSFTGGGVAPAAQPNLLQQLMGLFGGK